MADDLIDRMAAALKLGRATGSFGKHPSNIYVIAEEAATALTARDEEIRLLREALEESGRKEE